MRAAAWIAAALLAATLPAVAAPDVDALITYETRQLSAAGVTRSERWQERLVRRGDTVWTERVLPAGTPHAAETEHAGHKHFDFDAAARLVQREPGGQLRLRFIDRAQRVVVDVPKAEFAVVGFDGNWDAAACIVPPAVVGRMPAAPDGWRDEHANGWQHRVRWSEALQLPLRLESQRDDASIRRVVRVDIVAAAPSLPWAGLEAFTQKDYDDFSD